LYVFGITSSVILLPEILDIQIMFFVKELLSSGHCVEAIQHIIKKFLLSNCSALF